MHWIGWGSLQAKLSFCNNILFILEMYTYIREDSESNSSKQILEWNLRGGGNLLIR